MSKRALSCLTDAYGLGRHSVWSCSGGFFPAGINGKFANMTSAELTAALNAVMEGSPDSDSDKAGTDDNGAFGGSNFVFASIAAAVLALFAAF
jgi:hypothetical protein